MRHSTRYLLLAVLLSAGAQATFPPPNSRITNDPTINSPALSECEFETTSDPPVEYSCSQTDDDDDSYLSHLDDPEPPSTTPEDNLINNPPDNQIRIPQPPVKPLDPRPQPSSGGIMVAALKSVTKTQAQTLAPRGEGGGPSSAVPLIGMAVGLGCTTMAAVILG
ncbi:hypothetical protein FQN54_003225 [Arachnomyces sp. PD_36]|nr:hypothetical protein FQN54_003225 [Arachnomyces sp. PD_36]